MNCTAPLPESFPDRQPKEELLATFEKALKEFGYPKRAVRLVESVDSEYKEDGRRCYIAYTITFAVRVKVYRREEVLIHLGNGNHATRQYRVYSYEKRRRERVFKSQKDLF